MMVGAGVAGEWTVVSEEKNNGQETGERQACRDGIRYTRERIAGSSIRVNVFIGYHSNGDGKWLKIWADTSAKKGGRDGSPGERLENVPSVPSFPQFPSFQFPVPSFCPQLPSLLGRRSD